MNIYRVTLITILLSIIPGLVHAGQPDLNIKDAWIQEGPPNARVLAGFMQITNIGDKTVNIIAADSDLFESIEFHRTIHIDGMARMEKQQQLTIEPGATLKLEHGGYHLMLIQPARRLSSGETVDLTLKLSSDMRIPIKLPVRQPEQEQDHMHHHHHH
jgi:copper(I)-binding protein